MRRSTVALAAVLAALALCAGLFWVCGTLRAEVNVETARATEHPSAWEAVRDALAADQAAQVFSESLPDDPADGRLEDVTIVFSNPGLLPAEWISVSVIPAPGDVAVYSVANEGIDAPGRGTAQVNLKLVARADGTGARAYRVQYYVFGLRRTITVHHSPRG